MGAADALAESMNGAFRAISEEARSRTRLQQTQQLAARIDELQKNYDDLGDNNAANLAEKHALRTALAKLQPNHPLISNKSLQERIQKAGVTSMRIAGTWDAAAEAGDTFKY
jgi:hypothetical protein